MRPIPPLLLAVTALTKNIIAGLLKFAGYIHSHKNLAWEYFGPHFEKTRWPPGTFIRLKARPSRAKGIIGRDLKFAEYVPHYNFFLIQIFTFTKL